MKVYSHNDADGRTSAAIVAKYYGYSAHDIEFIEMDYKKEVEVEKIFPGEKIFIVDFSFKPEVMREVRKRTSDIVWIDHHESCRDYDYYRDNLSGLRDLTNKGPSGCELTWQYFFKGDNYVPPAVMLIGDYDSWRLEDPDSLKFYEAMKTIDCSPLSDEWKTLLGNLSLNRIHELIDVGGYIIHYRDNYCRDIIDMFGYETEIDGIKAYATNLYRFGSPGFLEKFEQYPICISYIYDGEKFTVSLYSREINVMEIAKKYKGGGHFSAAGIVCKELPFKRSVK
jgi:oligoribonuclease NrnB/cAMP/cGMP phosphodiesterase (DHH superfamily)